jgi:hypothetical protein
MFHPRRVVPGRLRTRMGMFASGMLIVYCGTSLLNRGIGVFRNSYRAEMYLPALVVTGGVLMLLALIPNSLVERWIKPEKKR